MESNGGAGMKLSIQMDDITPEQGIRVMRAALSVEVEKLQAAGKIPSHKPTDGLPAGAQPAGTPPVKKEAKNVPVKKTKPAKKKKGHRGRENKYLIPFPQGPEYCKAYRLCLKHRCTYPEVLVLENKSVENIQKSTEKVPAKGAGFTSKSGLPVRKQKALPLHQKNHEPEDPAKGARPQEIKLSGGSLTITESAPGKGSPAGEQPTEAKPAGPARFVKDTKVRQISGRIRFHGVATVKRVNDENTEALVDIGNGLEWIPLNILVAVPV